MSENINTKTKNTNTWENEKLNLFVIADRKNYLDHPDDYQFIMVHHTDKYGNMLERDDLYSAIASNKLESLELSDEQWNWLDDMAGEFEEFVYNYD
jgi:hypothetical protein